MDIQRTAISSLHHNLYCNVLKFNELDYNWITAQSCNVLQSNEAKCTYLEANVALQCSPI